jgi:hypothetical protein
MIHIPTGTLKACWNNCVGYMGSLLKNYPQSLLLLMYVGNFANTMCVGMVQYNIILLALGNSGQLCDPCMLCTWMYGCHAVMLSCCCKLL